MDYEEDFRNFDKWHSPATCCGLFSNAEQLVDVPAPPRQEVDTLTYWETVSLLDDYRLTESDVLEYAKDFVASDCQSRGEVFSSSLNIVDKQDVDLSAYRQTRATEHAGSESKIPIYTVEVKGKDVHGYSLVSGDWREQRCWLSFLMRRMREKRHRKPSWDS